MKMKPTPPEVLAWLKSEGHKGASAHRDRLGAVSRAYKDRPPMIPAPDEKGLIYDQMSKPTPMLKFGRSGAPHWRIFQVPFHGLLKVVYFSDRFLLQKCSRSSLLHVSLTLFTVGMQLAPFSTEMNTLNAHSTCFAQNEQNPGQLQLSADKTKITWSSPNKRAGTSQVLVSEIKNVVNSQGSKVFERMLTKRKDFKDLNSVNEA